VNRLRILQVGADDRPEFLPACDDLARHGDVLRVPDIAAGVEHLRSAEESADLVVLFQAYPGQYAAQEVDGLRRLVPLARVVCLLASWCEGEMRSGSPLSGVLRLYWHRWPVHGRREIIRLARGESTAWALPLTATDDDRLLAETGPLAPQSGLIVVCAREEPMAEWLVAACRLRGYATLRICSAAGDQVEGASAAIFDAGPFAQREADQLRCLAAAVRPAPVVALLEFPRAEDQRRSLTHGAVAILSKPLAINDLYGQFDDLAR
jgi:hypothetical protein